MYLQSYINSIQHEDQYMYVKGRVRVGAVYSLSFGTTEMSICDNIDHVNMLIRHQGDYSKIRACGHRFMLKRSL